MSRYLIKDKTSAEKALVALGEIRKLVGEKGKIVSAYGLSGFLYDAFELKEDRRNISKGLNRKNMSAFIMKVEGGFQINPQGIKHAEKMLSGKAEK